uniref:hypothetical protein n=1 Tax=Devosia sp. TaxID=1871048 RepID=UPI002FC697F5
MKKLYKSIGLLALALSMHGGNAWAEEFLVGEEEPLVDHRRFLAGDVEQAPRLVEPALVGQRHREQQARLGRVGGPGESADLAARDHLAIDLTGGVELAAVLVEAAEEVEGTQLGLDESGLAGALGGRPPPGAGVLATGWVEAGQGGVELDGQAGEVVALGQVQRLERRGAGLVGAPVAQRLGVDEQRAGEQLGRTVAQQLHCLFGDLAGGLGGVGEQQGRRERRQQLAPVGVGRVGRQGGEPRTQHLDRLRHPSRGGERLRAAAYERLGVDVGDRGARGVDQLEGVEEVGGGLRRTADRQRLFAGLDRGTD